MGKLWIGKPNCNSAGRRIGGENTAEIHCRVVTGQMMVVVNHDWGFLLMMITTSLTNIYSADIFGTYI